MLKGKWMYSREVAGGLVKMVEAGLLKLEKEKVLGKLSLEEWEIAFEKVKECSGSGATPVIILCLETY
jgi:hypothetical protein